MGWKGNPSDTCISTSGIQGQIDKQLKSHHLTVRSAELVASTNSEGWNSSPAFLLTSQTFRLVSRDPDAKKSPKGWKFTLRQLERCPVETFGLLQVPQLDSATLGTSYNSFLCIIEGDTLHWTLVSRQALQHILACQACKRVALAQ
ncbi:MAG: hypothetical protein FRX49_08056 [Trebouxia sp. A1-2]|nr:MAG: hypothetical protein FRX49_08056 [Trebouxia sp. A1-2]